MGGGNLQKSQMARARNQAKMGKEAQGGGGAEGLKSRQADASVHAAAQEARKAKNAERDAREAEKKAKELRMEQKNAKEAGKQAGAGGAAGGGGGAKLDKKAAAAAALAAAMAGNKPAPKKKEEAKQTEDVAAESTEPVDVADADAADMEVEAPAADAAAADVSEDAGEGVDPNDPYKGYGRVDTPESIAQREKMRVAALATISEREVAQNAKDAKVAVDTQAEGVKARITKKSVGITTEELTVLLGAAELDKA